MTSREVYVKYKGCTVTDGIFTGEVIGYWADENSNETILIGTRIDYQNRCWTVKDINNYDNRAIVPNYIPKDKYHFYRYISRFDLRVVSKPISSFNVNEMADNWLIGLKEFNNIDEETSNLLLNGFIAGAETIIQLKSE